MTLMQAIGVVAVVLGCVVYVIDAKDNRSAILPSRYKKR